ncbi:MAG: Holliday junction resolvase RuvX [Chloroflexi bacterium]|nr:Holliday junction resolvase RuvX [Chloroflexota bacterium]
MTGLPEWARTLARGRRHGVASDEQGRVMALDLGARRIGIALSDPTRTLASPLTTIRAEPRTAALARIAALIREHEVAVLVIGLPLTLNGAVGPQATLVQQFAAALREQVDVPVHMFDERLTSVAAERMMIDLGVKREQRKARIDEVAASLILQDFLDSQRHTGE